jgi:hypothetical protein
LYGANALESKDRIGYGAYHAIDSIFLDIGVLTVKLKE